MSINRINVLCSCGSDKFEMPPNPKAGDVIKCAKCGATGKYGDIMGQAKKQAVTAVEKQLKDVLRKAGFK
jgi:hypothetical protein